MWNMHRSFGLFLHFIETNLAYYFITDIIQLQAVSSIIHNQAWCTIYSSNFYEEKDFNTEASNTFQLHDK